MTLTLKRYELEDFSRQALVQAVEETRTQDQKQTCEQKQQAYAAKRQAWKNINQLIDVRS